MTLQALRDEVGDDAFWTILHTWTQTYAFDTGSTDAFIALAEQVSGQDLGEPVRRVVVHAEPAAGLGRHGFGRGVGLAEGDRARGLVAPVVRPA